MTPKDLRIFRSYFRLPPQPGGMEEHIAQLTDYQRRLGVDVVSIYNVGRGKAPEIRILENRDLNKVSSSAVREVIFYAFGYQNLYTPDSDRHNVLHVHGDFVGFAAAKLWRRKLQIQTLVATVHGALTRHRRYYRLALKGYDLVAATGAAEATKLSDWLDREVVHLPSGVSECFFSPQDMPPFTDIIAVGNLFPVKRTELIIRVAAALPNLRFSIFGNGPEYLRLRDMLRSESICNVTLHGQQSRETIACAMRGARLFLNVSRFEGTPTSVLEAMACGLPVLLTPSNNYDWLIKPGVNGYVTEGWDIQEILQRIEDCLENDDKLKAMSFHNKATAAQHRWGSKAQEFTKKILQSIEKRGF